MDFTPVCEKAYFSMHSNFESLSNEIESKREQCAKLDLHKIVTDDGIFIDFTPLPEKANSSIRGNREGLSN
jgi:hypothetical protein